VSRGAKKRKRAANLAIASGLGPYRARPT